MSWRDEANCVGLDDLFFPEKHNDPIAERAAKAVCADCPVRQQCLDEAMAFEGALAPDGRYGIWGGLNPAERSSLRRGKKPFQPAKCGTDSGYHRHKRVYREQPCEACRDAHREADRRRRQRMKEAS